MECSNICVGRGVCSSNVMNNLTSKKQKVCSLCYRHVETRRRKGCKRCDLFYGVQCSAVLQVWRSQSLCQRLSAARGQITESAPGDTLLSVPTTRTCRIEVSRKIRQGARGRHYSLPT